jgi:carboxymethylenebutenolidase
MGETITLKAADGHSFSAYAAGPQDAKRGVVVIQEIFGVNHWVRDMVDRFAAAGYRAVAPGLFDRAQPGLDLGYGPDDRKAGMEARAKVPEDGALKDIEATAAWLGSRPVAVVGYCWGGSMSWLTATKTHAVKAASCWYGGGIAANKTLAPNVPVQMHFGETDGSIPMADVEAIKAAQPSAEVYVYNGAGHGFGCNERDSYNEASYKLAQERTLAFFDKNVN